MNAIDHMILAEQIAALMDARFIGRPTREEAEQILRSALSQYDNYLASHPKALPENVVSIAGAQ